MKKTLQNNDNLLSDVISFLRFPLIIAVVLIHANVSTNNVETHTYYTLTRFLFSDILARVAVPVFFVFSGFLFFYKTDYFTKDVYVVKLKKRLWSLAFPYLFWVTLMVVCYLSLQFFRDANDIGKEFNFVGVSKFFWAYKWDYYPLSVQFWYVRDLLVVMILSPVIYWLIKKLHYLFIAFLLIVWICNGDWDKTPGLSLTSWSFFSLGAYFSIYKKNFAELLKSHTVVIGALYSLTILAILMPLVVSYIKGESIDLSENVLRRISILFGVVFAISLTARLIENKTCRANGFLAKGSFFVFAYHMLALPFVYKLLDKTIPLDKEIYLVVYYFVATILTVVLGLIFYYCLKRFCPRFTALITGGR